MSLHGRLRLNRRAKASAFTLTNSLIQACCQYDRIENTMAYSPNNDYANREPRGECSGARRIVT
jgi:hypothetical protein